MMNILISGTTNGIGRATASSLYKSGHNLNLVNRNAVAAEKLKEQMEANGGASGRIHNYQAVLLKN